MNEEFAEYDVTCRTEGCGNAHLLIRVYATVESPSVLCGPCGQQIIDITPVVV